MLRKAWGMTLIGVGTASVLTLTALPLLASDDVSSLTLHPVADTTATQVVQDGDNSAKTTLASCPQLCDGNRNGRRDAMLEFNVQSLPPTASDVRAKLRIYTWRTSPAHVVARLTDGGARSAGYEDAVTVAGDLHALDSVAQGFNEFDVSTAVKHNGSVTIALSQESFNTRVYWASQDNHRSDIRPELVLTYRTTVRPPGNASQPGSPMPSPTKPTTGPSASASASAPGSPTPTKNPGSTTSPPVPPGNGTINGWRMVWADEFNGSSVDMSKWNSRNEGRNIDIGCNTTSSQNLFQSGGILTIRALQQPATCAGQNRGYTEGYLDTIGKASWTYGRFETRAKSPNRPGVSKGLWPAFWLRPNDGGKGEIDVTELPGGDQYYKAATAAIFYDYTPIKQDYRYAFTAGYPGDGFHTYATEWEPGVLRWYIDGKLIYQRDRSTTPWFDEAFSKPFNLRLNFQVGGWLGNPDASTVFPADFQVDYVRVYQR